MAGLDAWIITVDRIGNIVQARGLADALGLRAEVKLIPQTLRAWMTAPFGPVPASERLGQPDAQFPRPFPTVVIGIGRAAVPYIRALQRHGGRRIFSLMLMDPRFHRGAFDAVWVPAHDDYSGDNAIRSLFALHSISPSLLDGLRADLAREIKALPVPRVTVVLGGRNKVFRYPPSDHRRLAQSLGSMARLGASFLVTPSRRTHPDLLDAVRGGTQGAPRLVWNGDGDNPYRQYLAAADFMVVTGDSANMTGEALATGRPVYVFEPRGWGPFRFRGKFRRLHEALYATGNARPLPDNLDRLEPWAARPVFAADEVAAAVEQRWLAQRRQFAARAGEQVSRAAGAPRSGAPTSP